MSLVWQHPPIQVAIIIMLTLVTTSRQEGGAGPLAHLRRSERLQCRGLKVASKTLGGRGCIVGNDAAPCQALNGPISFRQDIFRPP